MSNSSPYYYEITLFVTRRCTKKCKSLTVYSLTLLISTNMSLLSSVGHSDGDVQCALLVLTAVTGDYFVHLQQHHDVGRAFSDNATHAAIGFLTWITMISHLGGMPPVKARVLVQSLLCALISSAIDVDHFIAARSFHLKDATKLLRRPILHCTTLPLLAFLLIFVPARYCNCVKLETLGWIILAAFLSHHIRDAARRGLWFYPLGSTPPLGTGTYLSLTAILPIFLSLILNYTDSSLLKMQPYNRSVLIV